MKKVNILYIETGLGFGGAVTCLEASLKGLNKEKYNPVVISSHNDEATRRVIEETGAQLLYVKGYKRNGSINELIAKSARFGIFIKRIILVGIVFIEKIRRIPFFINVMRIAKRNKIDMIHLNTGIKLNSEVIIISKLLNIPCISHVRGVEYNSLETRLMARFLKYYIAMSKFVENSLTNLGIPQRKIKVIYDGINMDECGVRKTDIQFSEVNKFKFGKYNVGLFACLLPWKGHKVFIKAIENLVKNRNLKECKFFIVGEIPDSKSKFKEELIESVNRLGLSDYIVFTGYQEDVYQFMDKMDIIVHTSTSPEPFGRVIIEAMALGKPVIATKMGGPLEIIEDGIDGLLILPNEPSILAEKIDFLLKNSQIRGQISERAKAKVEKNFTLGKYINEVEKIYAKLLQ